MPTAGALEDRQEAARIRAQALLNEVFAQIPQGQSKHARSNYRGDRTVLQSFGLPSAKQLPVRLLESNFFHSFLQFAAHPEDEAACEAFMLAKLEPERFHQWAGELLAHRQLCYISNVPDTLRLAQSSVGHGKHAASSLQVWSTRIAFAEVLAHMLAGPAGITVTQVTPTVLSIPDAQAAFDHALANIFSAALKPLDSTKFMRAVKCRFRVSRYVAHTQGPEGLYRPDVPDTSVLKRFDRPHDLVRASAAHWCSCKHTGCAMSLQEHDHCNTPCAATRTWPEFDHAATMLRPCCCYSWCGIWRSPGQWSVPAGACSH